MSGETLSEADADGEGTADGEAVADAGLDADRELGMEDLDPYEVFVQWREDRPHEHAEVVNASDDDLALLFARRNVDVRQEPKSVWVVPRPALTTRAAAALDARPAEGATGDADAAVDAEREPFAAFVQWERGTPHEAVDPVEAADPDGALARVARRLAETDDDALNVWVAPEEAVTRSREDDTALVPSTDRGYRSIQWYAQHSIDPSAVEAAGEDQTEQEALESAEYTDSPIEDAGSAADGDAAATADSDAENTEENP